MLSSGATGRAEQDGDDGEATELAGGWFGEADEDDEAWDDDLWGVRHAPGLGPAAEQRRRRRVARPLPLLGHGEQDGGGAYDEAAYDEDAYDVETYDEDAETYGEHAETYGEDADGEEADAHDDGAEDLGGLGDLGAASTTALAGPAPGDHDDADRVDGGRAAINGHGAGPAVNGHRAGPAAVNGHRRRSGPDRLVNGHGPPVDHDPPDRHHPAEAAGAPHDLGAALASLREVLAQPEADTVMTLASRCRVEGAVQVLEALVEGAPWPPWAVAAEDRPAAEADFPDDVVRRILELRREGLDNGSIAKVLENLGVPALRGERWTGGGVKWVLLSERRARASAHRSPRPPSRR
jgi:hypothetical protein